MTLIERTPTDLLIGELERRAREFPGAWCGRDIGRLVRLGKSLNPLPIDAPASVARALQELERYGYF